MSTEAAARRLVLGTRGSELAMFQARLVAWHLQNRNVDLSVKIEKISTSGDRILESPLAKIGEKGLFVKEIENALIRGDIDLAVHSAKDLPTALPEGLTIGAFSLRDDPRDVFIGKAGSLRQIPAGGRVGTSSLRRRSQLLLLRPDLEIVDIRGNIDTRIRKIEELGLEGAILAAAGVRRLEKKEHIGFYFSTEEIVPAVGQGVIAIEVRRDDSFTRRLVQPENDEAAAIAVRAERALMKQLQGGCQVPIGAYGVVDSGGLRLDAYLGSIGGSRSVRDSIEGPSGSAEELGETLARQMEKNGGKEILAEVRAAQEGEGTGYWT